MHAHYPNLGTEVAISLEEKTTTQLKENYNSQMLSHSNRSPVSKGGIQTTYQGASYCRNSDSDQ